MSKSIPLIQKYMTTTPHSVGREQPLSIAQSLMNQHKIRHLPVMSDGQLVGILSDRDLKLAMSLQGVDPEVCKVGEIANEEAFLVKPDSKLDEVSKMMADKKIGSVLVVDHHRLVGIFTTTDALQALSELLETRLTH
ncbi:MAG: CBS domain-containing protein [Bdellovibrionales bacterium]|nr:CBS domain-containing protein [Bdellovibrionales bacterium]